MSDYGKLWEEVAAVRKAIKAFAPNINTDSLPAAIDSAKRHTKQLEVWLNEWQDIEEEMKKCDSETGNR